MLSVTINSIIQRKKKLCGTQVSFEHAEGKNEMKLQPSLLQSSQIKQLQIKPEKKTSGLQQYFEPVPSAFH